ncbi:MAG: hypothetical protein RIE24_22015 [Silicimonas sp.]|jgi:hypothetical protein|uniref:hypothetical protein n=1 Tax=Roseitalea porphyridii TaxID=1852022 RepID=UPI0032EAF261
MRGICQLTGSHGEFVDAHLLPKALTRAGRTKGEKFVEHGPSANRPQRRASSWYDRELVTQEGESLLQRFDDHGITELRRCGLVWSAANSLDASEPIPLFWTAFRAARVRSKKPKRLRMFVLSLLWRAGATNREEFVDFSMPQDEINHLSELLNRNEVGDERDFPTFFLYHTGKRYEHNHTPIYQRSRMHGSEIPADHYRFFLDGLVIFCGHSNDQNPFWQKRNDFAVGFKPEFGVFIQEFIESRQYRDLGDVISLLNEQEA